MSSLEEPKEDVDQVTAGLAPNFVPRTLDAARMERLSHTPTDIAMATIRPSAMLHTECAGAPRGRPG